MIYSQKPWPNRKEIPQPAFLVAMFMSSVVENKAQ
jgi:hypothetical protein